LTVYIACDKITATRLFYVNLWPRENFRPLAGKRAWPILSFTPSRFACGYDKITATRLFYVNLWPRENFRPLAGKRAWPILSFTPSHFACGYDKIVKIYHNEKAEG